MKRISTTLICGFSLTVLIFGAHLTVMHWFSWKDKPMLPNFFTYLLLPGYDLAAVFSIPIWLLLQIRYLVAHRSN